MVHSVHFKSNKRRLCNVLICDACFLTWFSLPVTLWRKNRACTARSLLTNNWKWQTGHRSNVGYCISIYVSNQYWKRIQYIVWLQYTRVGYTDTVDDSIKCQARRVLLLYWHREREFVLGFSDFNGTSLQSFYSEAVFILHCLLQFETFLLFFLVIDRNLRSNTLKIF